MDPLSLKIDELKSLCRARGLPVSGLKDDLVKRLMASSEKKGPTSAVPKKAPVSSKTTASPPVPAKKSTPTVSATAVSKKPPQNAPTATSSNKIPSASSTTDTKKRKADQVVDSNVPSKKTVKTLTAPTKPITVIAQSPPKPVSATVIPAKPTATSSSNPSALPSILTAEWVNSATNAQLKDMCKFKHLQTSGNKVDLVGRLLASCTPSHMLDQYKNATIPELKEICKAKGLPVSGTKTMLVERLMDPIGFKASAKKVAPPVVAADGLVTHFQEVYEPPVPAPTFAKRTPAPFTKPSTYFDSLPAGYSLQDDSDRKAFKQTTSSSSKLPRPKSSGCGLNSSGKKPTKLMCSHTGFSVISSFGYPRDGFHSFEPLEYKAWGCFDSAQNANVFAQHVFMTKADFGSDMEEILEETSLEEDCTGGMLSMRVHPDDSEAWKVWVAAVVNGALGKGSEYDYEDEDEIEDEDDGYGNGYGYSYAF